MDPTIEFTGSSLQIYSQIDDFIRKNGLATVTVQVVAFDPGAMVDPEALFVSSLNPEITSGEIASKDKKLIKNFNHYKCVDGCGRNVQAPGVRCTSCVIFDEKIW